MRETEQIIANNILEQALGKPVVVSEGKIMHALEDNEQEVAHALLVDGTVTVVTPIPRPYGTIDYVYVLPIIKTPITNEETPEELSTSFQTIMPYGSYEEEPIQPKKETQSIPKSERDLTYAQRRQLREENRVGSRQHGGVIFSDQMVSRAKIQKQNK